MSRGRVILGIMFLLLLLRWCSSESTSILDPTGSGYEGGYDEGYEDGIADTCILAASVSQRFYIVLREQRICF